MNCDSDLLLRYVEKAKAVGVEVDLLPAGSLAERLEALLGKLGAGPVALSARGWPAETREQVARALDTLGRPVVSPTQTGGGDFNWDRPALAQAVLGVTWADSYVADTGSLVFPSGPGFATAASLLPFVHLTLSTARGVAADFAAYLGPAPTLPSRLTLVTGPSRTGDIEGTMTTGVHGPGRVLHWILDSGA